MEQGIMLPERLVLFIDVRLGDLVGHIAVRDFRDIGQEEHPREREDEYADGQIHPLHALQRLNVVRGLREEGVRAQDGSDDGADGIECLGEVDPYLRILWWTADCCSL